MFALSRGKVFAMPRVGNRDFRPLAHLVPLARALYASGLSGAQVAAGLGVSKPWVVENVHDIARDASESQTVRGAARSTHWRSARCTARRVWERTHGPIPPGHHIHHIDGDYTNNAPENLACLSDDAHNRLHAAENARRRWSA